MTRDLRLELLPEHMRESAREYVEEHAPVGGFLSSVLANDLAGAAIRADADNAAALVNWGRWLDWADLPDECWGSRTKVRAWVDARLTSSTLG